MAQFDFPSSPSTNQTYTANSITFKWDGVAWRRITSTGAQGNAGAQGAQGHQGAGGTPGAQGAANTGAQGAQGYQGSGGTPGAQGAQGYQGTPGAQGASAAGAQGAQGYQGTPGAQGAANTGAQGSQGYQGHQGAANTGAQGSQGYQGHQGAANTGAQGAQGYQGNNGAQGDNGNSVTGAQGAQGYQGNNGAQGASNTGGSGFVNAADYGLNASATDGTNATAINNAVTALGTNGGTIFFPGGMFYLNASITLGNSNNSIRFVGSGHQNYGGGSDTGGTVLRRDQDDEFFNITNSRAIHFIGITFKGGIATSIGGNGDPSATPTDPGGISGGNGAIYVLANPGCQGYLIENCVFHGIANCITFKGLSDSIIRGCRFRNVPTGKGNGACIKLDENGSEVIDQIRIQDCVLDGSPNGSALNNAIDGIAIYNKVSTVYVTNTSAIRLNRSFYSDSSWDGDFFYFQNSEAERASSDGFSLNGTGNFITIDNCFSCTNNGHGINILSNQNSSVNITNPNVRDNVGHGILIDTNTINNCSIVNPAIGGNSKNSSGTNHGIFIGANVNNIYIAGGKIGGNTSELSGTGTQGRGILINGSSHSNIRIIGTNVNGNQDSDGIGASISSGSGNSIKFNAGSSVDIDT